jgi:ubiquinone/menaquinone biosynthesis C-methylase UbiE
MAQTDTAAGTYLSILPDFVETLERLAQNGQPYSAVLLAHELFRFLYPVEPYAALTHDDPVEFATTHIKRMLDLGEALESGITPYQFDLGSTIRGDAPIERTTSDLYTGLWQEFETETLTDESLQLLGARIPETVIRESLVGREALDQGCGSGRFTIALAGAGAARAVGVDVQAASFAGAARVAAERGLPVEFVEGNVHELPFEDESFDFVLSNGVLHHTTSISKGLSELARVMRSGGAGFLYLYASGGIFWETRNALRRVFRSIPFEYSQSVLRMIGMPPNRFIFCDTWYVPIETHTTTEELTAMLDEVGLEYQKVAGQNAFDLDGAIERGVPGAEAMWGSGEHRYVLRKSHG